MFPTHKTIRVRFVEPLPRGRRVLRSDRLIGLSEWSNVETHVIAFVKFFLLIVIYNVTIFNENADRIFLGGMHETFGDKYCGFRPYGSRPVGIVCGR